MQFRGYVNWTDKILNVSEFWVIIILHVLSMQLAKRKERQPTHPLSVCSAVIMLGSLCTLSYLILPINL